MSKSNDCEHLWKEPLKGYTICEKCGETQISYERRWEVGLIWFPLFSGYPRTEQDRPFDELTNNRPIEFSRWIRFMEESKKLDVEKTKEDEKQSIVVTREKNAALTWLKSQNTAQES